VNWQKKAADIMNQLGSHRIPFLFIIDFYKALIVFPYYKKRICFFPTIFES